MGNIIFIIWRESIEALLVIAILYSWLRENDNGQLGFRYLWGGIFSGIILALLLAWAMLKVQSELAEQALEYFQIGMMFIAAALICQMVFWMRRHARKLKSELEANLSKASQSNNGLAVAILAMLAVAREGAETVIFVYGSNMAQSNQDLGSFYISIAVGFGLAFITYYLLNSSSRFLSWPRFFRFSEIVLLLLASALLVGGCNKLIGLNLLPALIDPVWDTRFLIDDQTAFGNLLSSLTGYHARPALMLVLIDIAFWSIIYLAFRQKTPLLDKK